MLEARLAERDERVGALVAENRKLAEENADLRRRLGQNPRKSDRPPSSEGLGRPESLRQRSGRKPGGQPGHPGSTLRQVDEPDVVVRHEPTVCSGCGDTLAGAAEVDVVRRPVFEIPPVKAER